MRWRLSRHAEEELVRRGLDRAIIERTLVEPGQIVAEHGGRNCYQSLVDFGDGRFLVRVIVVEHADTILVVTAYRTSRVAKYWRQP